MVSSWFPFKTNQNYIPPNQGTTPKFRTRNNKRADQGRGPVTVQAPGGRAGERLERALRGVDVEKSSPWGTGGGAGHFGIGFQVQLIFCLSPEMLTKSSNSPNSLFVDEIAIWDSCQGSFFIQALRWFGHFIGQSATCLEDSKLHMERRCSTPPSGCGRIWPV